MQSYTSSFQKASAETDTPPRRRWWRLIAVVALVLGIGGLAWAVRPDPHLRRAKALQKELSSPEAKNLPPEERKARFAEFREQVKHLNDDQKWELSAPMREKQKAEMDHYFAMSPQEKTKYLDEKIDRSEKMRKEREQKAAQRKASQGNGGPPGTGPVAFKGGGGGGPGANKAGTPGDPSGRPKGQPPSAEEIEKRKKQFLERTTPDERAKMDRFRKEMNDRRRQRGLPIRT